MRTAGGASGRADPVPGGPEEGGIQRGVARNEDLLDDLSQSLLGVAEPGHSVRSSWSRACSHDSLREDDTSAAVLLARNQYIIATSKGTATSRLESAPR